MCTYTESGILNCGGYGGGGGGYGAGIGTPGYNPGYCGPWNASCADGRGYYGSTPEWVLTGHWSKPAMNVLMRFVDTKLKLVPTQDYCTDSGRTINYDLQGRGSKDYYVREELTYVSGYGSNNGKVVDVVNGGQLNGFTDWLSNGVGRADNVVSQRFLTSPNDPAKNTSGSFLVQIQRTLGGWPVMLDKQSIVRNVNGDVLVAGTPCPQK